MKNFLKNKIALSSIIALMVCAIVILIFTLVNAKYVSSFKSTLSLTSEDAGKYYIIANPYECHTSSSDESGTYTHFGYYDTTAGVEDPMAHITYVAGLKAGNAVTVNDDPPKTYSDKSKLWDNGGFYSLKFPTSASIHYAGADTGSDKAFGALANWYDYAWNYSRQGAPPWDDSLRWVDNRNYIFYTHTNTINGIRPKRWFWAPMSDVSFNTTTNKWSINWASANVRFIEPGVSFSVPDQEGFFIANYEAHWTCDGFWDDPEAWTQEEISKTAQHFDRYNVWYDTDQQGQLIDPDKDDVWFEAKSGIDDPTKETGRMFINRVQKDERLEHINGWDYEYYLSFSQHVLSPGDGGPVIYMHNPNHKLIQKIALVMTLDESISETQLPIFKIVDHNSSQTTYYTCASISKQQAGSHVFVFELDYSAQIAIAEQDVVDIFVNTNGGELSKIKIWGIYVDWVYGLGQDPDPLYYSNYVDGMFVPDCLEGDVIYITNSNNAEDAKQVNFNIDNSILCKKDKTMLNLNWLKKENHLYMHNQYRDKHINMLAKRNWFLPE